MSLDLSKAEQKNIREMDASGSLYELNGKLYRTINNSHAVPFRKLMESGLIEELVTKNLFPASSISDQKVDGFDLVIEHEKLPVVTYPYEWTFNMFKAAAHCILEVNAIAKKYGFRTIDAHAYNIVFHYDQPLFVDLGSFVEVNNSFTSWLPFENFMRHYYYTLKIWQKGDNFIAERILSRPFEFTPHSTYHLYNKSCLSRFLKPDKIDQLYGLYHKFRLLSFFSDQELENRHVPFKKAVLILRKMNMLPFQKFNFQKWMRKVSNLKSMTLKSQWGDYHSKFDTEGSTVELTPRLNKILEIVNQTTGIKSVLELAGNQGALAREIRRTNSSLEQVICTDYDEVAINKLFNTIQQTKEKIEIAKFNFIYPITTAARSAIDKRIKCDMVLALAVTHHLILTQRIPIQVIFDRLKAFSNKYVIVEFMPKGLISPATKNVVETPDWYTQDWFESAFRKNFELLQIEELEPNRVVFVGKIISH